MYVRMRDSKSKTVCDPIRIIAEDDAKQAFESGRILRRATRRARCYYVGVGGQVIGQPWDTHSGVGVTNEF